VPLTATVLPVGPNVYPVFLGVIVLLPLAIPVNIKFPSILLIVVTLLVTLRVKVTPDTAARQAVTVHDMENVAR